MSFSETSSAKPSKLTLPGPTWPNHDWTMAPCQNRLRIVFQTLSSQAFLRHE